MPRRFRTSDGHWVRSKSELMVANFLFLNRLWYQYERPVTIVGVSIKPDFFLPGLGPKGTHLEHFGMLDNPVYRDLARRKADLFRKANPPRIATREKDVDDIDTSLHRKLSQAGAILKAP